LAHGRTSVEQPERVLRDRSGEGSPVDVDDLNFLIFLLGSLFGYSIDLLSTAPSWFPLLDLGAARGAEE